eukprot:3935971-Rhodomonas_salina.2
MYTLVLTVSKGTDDNAPLCYRNRYDKMLKTGLSHSPQLPEQEKHLPSSFKGEILLSIWHAVSIQSLAVCTLRQSCFPDARALRSVDSRA